MGRDLGLGANTIGQWEAEANPGLRLSYLVLLADYFTKGGLPWDWNEVMRFFGSPEPKGFDQIASAIASRSVLREHFEVIARWDDREVQLITASLRPVPPKRAVKKA